MQKPGKNTYELDYSQLPFEDILREYRQQNIIKTIVAGKHRNILEIGCGPQPLFIDFHDFERMVVVEPLTTFFAEAKALAGADARLVLINGAFEDIADQLIDQNFDLIIIGGFLHEISNPEEVLKAVAKVATAETVIHSFVPNANSFHRLLAFEMGIIDNVYQKSGHDEMFERFHVYNLDTFIKLFDDNGFHVTESGSYFIKPYTHSQLHDMLAHKIIGKSVIDGFNKMTKYFPLHGAEIFVNSRCKNCRP